MTNKSYLSSSKMAKEGFCVFSSELSESGVTFDCNSKASVSGSDVGLNFWLVSSDELELKNFRKNQEKFFENFSKIMPIEKVHWSCGSPVSGLFERFLYPKK